ncbi:MAG TPA: hypothetical protein VLK35_13635 [Methylomirabilota bacterium]|nr:hypothetical protein [Methylomirabilota bacterium]
MTAALALAVWSVGIEPGWVVTRETRVPVAGWPSDHGGQVNLPVLGRLIVPSRYGERFAIGHVHDNGRDLFVSPGIGTSIIPVRFRVPPEISLLTVGQ